MKDNLNLEVLGSWGLCLIGFVTAQDIAYISATMVSVGAMIINFDRYKAALKRMFNRNKGEQS